MMGSVARRWKICCPSPSKSWRQETVAVEHAEPVYLRNEGGVENFPARIGSHYCATYFMLWGDWNRSRKGVASWRFKKVNKRGAGVRFRAYVVVA